MLGWFESSDITNRSGLQAGERLLPRTWYLPGAQPRGVSTPAPYTLWIRGRFGGPSCPGPGPLIWTNGPRPGLTGEQRPEFCSATPVPAPRAAALSPRGRRRSPFGREEYRPARGAQASKTSAGQRGGTSRGDLPPPPAPLDHLLGRPLGHPLGRRPAVLSLEVRPELAASGRGPWAWPVSPVGVAGLRDGAASGGLRRGLRRDLRRGAAGRRAPWGSVAHCGAQ